MDTPFSIVIPCKNEAENIGRLFDSILYQKQVDVKNIPIYVADANSTDGTLQVIDRYVREKGLHVTVVPGGYPAAGRNSGARHADTDYLLFLDADITLGEPTFLHTVSKIIADRKAHLVSSYIRCYNGNWFDTFFWKVFGLSLHISSYFKPLSSGMFTCVRRDIFWKVGGFDEKVILGEDVELSLKIDRRYYRIADTFIYTTNRRFKKMGYLNTIIYYTLVAFSPRFRHRNNAFYFEEKKKLSDSRADQLSERFRSIFSK